MRSLGVIVLAVALASMAVVEAHAGLTVNGYVAAPEHYDRFANSDDFIGSAYDWSGVGRTSGVSTGVSRWGVLISPSFMLSATHFAPGLGDAVRFYTSNDPTGSYVERTVLSNVALIDTAIGVGSDLTLTKLSGPAAGIATYAIGNPASSLVGQELFVWGQADNPVPFLNMRLGRNQVTDVLPAFTALGLVSTGDVFEYDYNTVSGLGPDEARLVAYDSGGPSFVDGPGGLALVGIHWYVYDADPKVPGSLPGSGDTLVTSFINELNAAMSLTSLERVTVAAVPEPTSFAWLAVGLLLHRRRRSALPRQSR